MPKLQPSLTGDNYTEHEKDQFWLQICHQRKCPQCGALDSMLSGPHGGIAQHIKCSYCNMIFCITPFRDPGAYPIRDDTPTQAHFQALSKLFFEDPLYLEHNKEDDS